MQIPHCLFVQILPVMLYQIIPWWSHVKITPIFALRTQVTKTVQLSYKQTSLISKPVIEPAIYGLSWCGMQSHPLCAACITKHGMENTSCSDRQDNLDSLCMMYCIFVVSACFNISSINLISFYNTRNLIYNRVISLPYF
jgi:hypothetical protein